MRFMHISDVHLGAAPDHEHPWAQDRGRELWEGFRRCIQDANRKKADLLLIAGDLFHRTPTLQELKEVNYLFSTLERTIVVLMAGNRDFLQPGSPCLTFPWNENVIGLFSPECECVKLPELKTELYGFSYYRPEIAQPLYDQLQTGRSDYFKILLAHGGDAAHIPMDRERLQQAGFDYIALGHCHNPQVYIPNLAMYAGAPEPVRSSDLGPHGYLIGEVQRKKVKLSFVAIGTREYRREILKVTAQDTEASIRERIAAVIAEGGDRHMYQFALTGERSPRLQFDPQSFLDCGRILEVRDLTVPAYDLEELKRRYQGELIGDYIASFGEPPYQKTEEKALRYGLEALMKQT